MADDGSRATLFGRMYAAGYDLFMRRLERHGGSEHRRRTVEPASGDVLEIGAGTGKNLSLYRSAARVVALEPDPGMRQRAARAAQRAQVPVGVIEGDAQSIPLPDASFDTVVSSLVLCTVPEPGRVLEEIKRVLRPGGMLRFYEHVRASDPKLARRQDRFLRPWRWFGRGCHPNRPTVDTISSSGFKIVELDAFDFKAAPSIVRPHVIGVASPT